MSVAALARKAGVSRASFYLHFDSAEALGLTALSELFDFIVDSSLDRLQQDHASQYDVSRIAFSEVAAFVAEHPRFYTQLIGPGAAPTFIQAAVDRLAEQTLASFQAMDLPTRVDPAFASSQAMDLPTRVDLAFASRFFDYGALGMIGTWLASGAEKPHDNLAQDIVDCLPAWLVGADIPSER